MKHAIIVPAAILFFVACNALAAESYKHEYTNGGHFEGEKVDAIAGQENAGAAMKKNDPYKLAIDSEGNIDFDALPPTAAGVAEPKASPASNE